MRVAVDAAFRLTHVWNSRLEERYAVTLRQVARKIGSAVRKLFNGTPLSVAEVADVLELYSTELEPWARTVAAGMLERANTRNYRTFKNRSEEIGRLLRREAYHAPTGAVMQESLARQVGLITSLPREAAERIQTLATSRYLSGQRVGEIRRLAPGATGPLDKVPEGLAKEILETGEVTASRANLIARTETTRVSTELTKARSNFIGSEEFIWWTAHDADVRPLHRSHEGKTFRWDDPPVADERTGIRALPGCIWNCRCWAQPVIPKHLLGEED